MPIQGLAAAAAQYSEMFGDAVARHTRASRRVIDEACARAEDADVCGVRVDYYPLRTVATVDPDVPLGAIHEHWHHDETPPDTL